MNADDNRILRFARESNRATFGEQTQPHPGEGVQTEIINISQSGMAFVVERQFAPQIDEIIKVEFAPAPEAKSLAWFARVVRIELPEQQASWKTRSNSLRVGIRFEEPPPEYQQELRANLQQRARSLRRQARWQALRNLRRWLGRHYPELILVALTTAATIGVLYILTQPSPSYDPEHPTVWGERFR